jgi:uncharacterized repeat protein (TIGR03803 family)
MSTSAYLHRRAWLGFALGLATDLAVGRSPRGPAPTRDTPAGRPPRVHYRTTHSFAPGEGSGPSGGITLASDGLGYGITSEQGAYGYGTLYRIDRAERIQTLHDFAGLPVDGEWPFDPLIEGDDGALYGATYRGGAYERGFTLGGTLFRLDRDGRWTLLHEFSGHHGDGDEPNGPLLLASDGQFYGTTLRGGDGSAGTVFRMDHDGHVTIVRSFRYDRGIGWPLAGLIEGPDGRLYGTCSGDPGPNAGGIFSMEKDGSDARTLHKFNWHDGAQPQQPLTLGSDGSLYGNTANGGNHANGTLFRLHPSGQLTVLHGLSEFKDGGWPSSPLLEVRPGVFIGSARYGGPTLDSAGTLFMIRPNRRFELLHVFRPAADGTPDGYWPSGPLSVCPEGQVIGTCIGGGLHDQGTIWKLVLPDA